MKYDLIILILPAFFIILTVFVKLKTKHPKALFLVLVSLSIYLSLGIYIPAMVWLANMRTHVKQITFVDENDKPVDGVGVILESSYKIGSIAGFSSVEYRIEAGISDLNGNVTVTTYTKPLPIFLFPILLRFDNGGACFVYRNGYYPELQSADNYNSNLKIVIKNVTDSKHLYHLLDKYHYFYYKNICNFVNIKSAECYLQVYRDLMVDAQQLLIYDEYGTIANSYKAEYQRLTKELKQGGLNEKN